MKKFKLFFLLLSFISFIACSDSDDSNNDEDQSEAPINPVNEFPANFQGTGSSANDILSNTAFNSIRVEIAFVEGFRPTDQAMDGFEDFLQLHSFKENIELIFTELPSPDDDELTLNEISDLEIENRTVYNDGSTLGIYIYFADAPSENDDLDEGLFTLGAVYRNTSMVIYESTIRELLNRSGNTPITTADVEGATLNHEFGHLMGLVNLGTVAINDHEDTTTDDDGNVVGNNHCNVPGCLMLAQLTFNSPTGRQATSFDTTQNIKSDCSLNGVNLLQQLELSAEANSNIVPILDAECRLDLSNNGGRPSTDI